MKHLLNERAYHYRQYFDFFFSNLMDYLRENAEEDSRDLFKSYVTSNNQTASAMKMRNVFGPVNTDVDMVRNGFGQGDLATYVKQITRNTVIGFYYDTVGPRASFLNDFGTPCILFRVNQHKHTRMPGTIAEIIPMFEERRDLIGHEFVHLLDAARVAGKAHQYQIKDANSGKKMRGMPKFGGYRSIKPQNHDNYFNATHEINAYMHMILQQLGPAQIENMTFADFLSEFYIKINAVAPMFMQYLTPENKRRVMKDLYDYYHNNRFSDAQTS